jgi:hypothetical protein
MIVARSDESKEAVCPFCTEILVEEQRRIVEGLAAQGVDFCSDTWNISKWCRRRILGNRPLQLRFGKTGKRIASRLGFIEPHVKYLIGKMRLDEGAADTRLFQFIGSMIKLSCFLEAEGYRGLGGLTKDTFRAYENYILKLPIVEIYKQRCLSHAYFFIRGLGMDIDWRPPLIVLSRDHRISDRYIKNLKSKRIPEDVIVQLLSLAGRLIEDRHQKISSASWTTSDDHDLLICAVLILLLGSYTRIGEILSLECDCEFDTPQGYALRITAEKSHSPELRTVAPEYVPVVKDILKTVREVTDLSRSYTRFWEEKGEIKYVIGEQRLSQSLFCFMKRGEKNRSSYGVTRSLMRKLQSRDTRATLQQFLNLTAINPLSESAIKSASLRLPEIMFHSYKRDDKTKFSLADLAKTLLGTGDLFTYQRFHQLLIKKDKSSFPGRYKISHNGAIYHFNSHQIRHFNTTLMLNQGLSMEIVDKLHGRVTPDQSKAYDHPDYAESYIREVRTAQQNNPAVLIDGHRDVLTMKAAPFTVKGDLRSGVLQLVKERAVIGPAAREIQRLGGKLRSRKISAVDFEQASWQFMPMVSISPTRLGFCTHAWAESPCSYHYECLCTDETEICEKLLPFVHPAVLKQLDEIRKDFTMQAELVKKRENSPYKALWERILTAKLKNICQIEHEVRLCLEMKEAGGLIVKEGDDHAES